LNYKVVLPFEGSDFIISFVANHARIFKISQAKFLLEKSKELESEKFRQGRIKWDNHPGYMGLTLVFLKIKGSLMKGHLFGKIVCIEESLSELNND